MICHGTVLQGCSVPALYSHACNYSSHRINIKQRYVIQQRLIKHKISVQIPNHYHIQHSLLLHALFINFFILCGQQPSQAYFILNPLLRSNIHNLNEVLRNILQAIKDKEHMNQISKYKFRQLILPKSKGELTRWSCKLHCAQHNVSTFQCIYLGMQTKLKLSLTLSCMVKCWSYNKAIPKLS